MNSIDHIDHEELVERLREAAGQMIRDLDARHASGEEEILGLIHKDLLTRLDASDQRYLREYVRMRVARGKKLILRFVLEAIEHHFPLEQRSGHRRPMLRVIQGGKKHFKVSGGAATPPDGGNAA